MRTWNFVKGQRLASFFRLCLAIIVALTLAVGGMTLNTKPVQAAITISQPSPCPYTVHVKPCLPGELQFEWSGTGFPSSTPADDWTWWWSGLSPALTDPNSYAYLDEDSGILSYRFCEDDAGKTFTFWVIVTEHSATC